MKSKIVLGLLAVTLLASCGSHCNINKWRCRRYVQATPKAPAAVSPNRPA